MNSVSLSRADILNQVRKNVAILSRNVTNFPYSSSDVYISKWKVLFPQDVKFLSSSDPTLTRRSVLVYGDIYIEEDFVDSDSENSRVFVALKDTDGSGGNIYIKNNVKRIDASLIAESMIISGDQNQYYTDSLNSRIIMKNQLYIYGTVISQNTIGWASVPWDPICPSMVSVCDDKIATYYDLEHFRYYRVDTPDSSVSNPLPRSAASLSALDKKAGFIIEYNPNILSNPPPWLSNIK